jgi:hypothetical protein
MAQLPIPGGDAGTWGSILNDFLSVSLNGDGTIQPVALTAAGGVTSVNTITPQSGGNVTLTAANIGAYAKPSGGIPATDLSSTVQSDLTAATTAVQSVNGLTGPTVSLTPSTIGALPTTTKLAGLADTSGAAGASNNQVLAYDSTTSQWIASTVSSTTVSDATTSSKGIVELSGDLGGTAASPSVLKVNGTSVSGTPSSGQALIASSSTAAAWTALPSAPVTSVNSQTGAVSLTASEVGAVPTSEVGTASGVASLNSSGQVPTTQLATGSGSTSNYLRGDGSWATPLAGSTTLAADTDVALASPANNQVLTYNSGSSKWVNQNAPTASNATISTPGLIQLDGDLSGTATSPTVASLQGTTVPATAPSSGQVLTATSSSATAWQTPASAPVSSVDGMTGAITGLLLASNNLSDVTDAGSSRANIHIPVLTPAAAAATTNVSSLSGLITIDGYTLASGDLVLLTAQSASSQNGLWSPAPGPWTRPTEFATGATIKGRTCEIQNGTNYGGTTWVLTTPTAGIVIGTGGQSWSQLSAAFSTALVQVAAPTGVAATDTAAIQNAINTATPVGSAPFVSGGLTVLLQKGIYVVNGLTMLSLVHIVGQSPDTTVIQLAANANTNVITGQNFASLTGTDSNAGIYTWSVERLTIDGNASNNTSGDGICIYGYEPRLFDVEIRNCAGLGLYHEWGNTGAVSSSTLATGSMEGKVRNLKIQRNLGGGINWQGPSDSQFNQVVIAQNGPTTGTTTIGWLIGGNSYGAQISDSHIWGQYHNIGMRVDVNSSLTDVEVEGAATDQLWLRCNSNVIKGGEYFQPGTSGAVIRIGDTAESVSSGDNDIDTRCSAGGILFDKDAGANTFKVHAYMTSGNVFNGTADYSQPSLYEIFVDGGANIGSLSGLSGAVTPRVVTTNVPRVLALSANSATPAINTDSYDVLHITGQSTAITSFTSGLTGSPTDGCRLRISVTGAASVGLTFGSFFESSAVTLPTTTSGTSRLDTDFIWNSETSKPRSTA